ncbi:hypothetical protein [Caldivirga maquilingensis]|uniref:hypothetical protein n=1 Tax=Caldivirga maquilingensis TaxID=76887 RepID=UPI0000F24BB6|nr:hypothetical protein [Caldivirga maquilingensis]
MNNLDLLIQGLIACLIIIRLSNGEALIDSTSCVGCLVCAKVRSYDAIRLLSNNVHVMLGFVASLLIPRGKANVAVIFELIEVLRHYL